MNYGAVTEFHRLLFADHSVSLNRLGIRIWTGIYVMAGYAQSTEITDLVERRRRVRILAVVGPAVTGLLLVLARSLFGDTLGYFIGIPTELFGIVGLFLLGTAGVSAVFWYLQTGFKTDTEAEEVARYARSDLERTQVDLKAMVAASNDRRAAQDAQIASLREQLTELYKRTERQAQVDTAPIVAELLERVRKEASKDFLRQVEASLQDTARTHSISGQTQEIFSINQQRLESEIYALSRRGNLNLVLGGITTLAGLILLGFFVIYDRSSPKLAVDFAVHFVPRVTLVIFIQVFAYFFLRLYKSSLSEIKYFQNELTTIQQRQIAILSATALDDETRTLSAVINNIARTDRNPILSAPSDGLVAEHDRNLIQTIGEAVKNVASVLPGKS